MLPTLHKLVFFTPPAALEAIKAAIFATGAGTYDKYTECCFVTPGVGQFRPSAEANPHIGTPGQLEEVGEVRVEVLCTGLEQTRHAVAELKRTHPYETVAYDVYKLENI